MGARQLGRYAGAAGRPQPRLRVGPQRHRLVANGVYTIWHAFMALPPTTPFSGTLDLPLGARDGSESVFRADANGNATVERRFQPCLQFSDVWTTSMLAVNYHSDGKTYQADPGKFGYNAHIPLFLMLPNREGIE